MSATKTAEAANRIQTFGGHCLNPILSAAWTDNRLLILIAVAFVIAGFTAQALLDIPGLMRDVLYRAAFEHMLIFLLLPLPLALLVGRLQVRGEDGRFLPGPAGWRIAGQRFVDRFANPLFWCYTGLIVIATVHLGWHYAIDGYVSIVAVWLYWKLSARLAPRMPSSPDRPA